MMAYTVWLLRESICELLFLLTCVHTLSFAVTYRFIVTAWNHAELL